MLALELEKTLKEFLQEKFKDTLLEVPKKKASELQVLRPIKVETGYLPPESASSQVPCIVLRTSKQEEKSENDGNIEVRFYVAIYNQDTSEGYATLMNYLSGIKNEIFSKYVFEKFTVTYPCRLTPYEEQMYPVWMGEVVMNFEAPTINRSTLSLLEEEL
ncbi:hypothetical protein [Ilyobacter sp.]|uniref:hypothetical protein n=1 Tax=Ilyobacter sp. TaxID=3100343 RepID=UPI0035634265